MLKPCTLEKVKLEIGKNSPDSQVIESRYGNVPITLVLGTDSGPRIEKPSVTFDHHLHHNLHGNFSTWHWACDRPLSLLKLRSLFENLPQSIYRAKGIVYLEEIPDYQVILQKVGKRSSLKDGTRWGSEIPRTELVMIGVEGGIDGEAMRTALEKCVRIKGEDMTQMMRQIRELTQSPISP